MFMDEFYYCPHCYSYLLSVSADECVTCSVCGYVAPLREQKGNEHEQRNEVSLSERYG